MLSTKIKHEIKFKKYIIFIEVIEFKKNASVFMKNLVQIFLLIEKVRRERICTKIRIQFSFDGLRLS